MFRAREIWLWAFALPLVFFYFIGTIFSGAWDEGAADPLGVLVPADAGVVADQLIQRLHSLDYNVVRVDNGAELARYTRQLTIPPGFTASVQAQRPVKVQFHRKSKGIGADYDELRLRRAIYTVLGDLALAANPKGGAAAMGRITMDVAPAGKRKKIPEGFQQSVPGSMVFFTIMVLFTSGGVTLFNERSQGILRRLASSPMSRASVVGAKFLARLGLGAIQIAFAMIAGTVLFHVDWGPHLGAVIAVMLAYASLAAAIGMLLGNAARTQPQVIAFGALGANLLASLGGCWWPVEITPAWFQKLAHVLPTGIAMDALHQLLSFGADPSAVFPHIIVLSGGALLAGWWMSRKFRFE